MTRESKTELLLPAGNIEKLQYAIAYGADAVYLGTTDFSLRSPKSGNTITNDNLKHAVETAHQMGAKAYVTLNVFANNEIMEKMPEQIELLQEAKPDAVIFADPGFYNTLREKLPDVDLHISTQANVLNYEAVKFWRDMGVSRIILARELSLKEIEQISNKVPDIELEVLVHGSMCVAYSGRCLLSDYLTNNERKANLGNCYQPCRWQYKLIEQRKDQEFEITEDQHGTYILNPKDLALIEYIPALINAGVHSFKIEGRTKSVYYASLVAKAYKAAIRGEKPDYEELMNAGNRGFSTGFMTDKPDDNHYNYYTGKNESKSVFQGLVTDKISSNIYKLQIKNQIKPGENVDFITPQERINTVITEIFDLEQQKIEVANTNTEVLIKVEEEPENWHWGIIRCKEKTNDKIETHVHCGACN